MEKTGKKRKKSQETLDELSVLSMNPHTSLEITVTFQYTDKVQRKKSKGN